MLKEIKRKKIKNENKIHISDYKKMDEQELVIESNRRKQKIR